MQRRFFICPRESFLRDISARMKCQRLSEMRQKKLSAVVAGIEMKIMWDTFFRELPVEFGGSPLKSEFIFASTAA
jgi:hypothetical protein